MPNEARALRTNLVKRACDSCKIRKVKCSETSPCYGCVKTGIACTFNTVQSTRGPRSLRPKTIRKIAETQGGHDENARTGGQVEARSDALKASSVGSNLDLVDQSALASTRPSDAAVNTLLHALSIYRRRLYPIWPIVDVHQLKIAVAAGEDGQARLLASVIRLATIAQLRLETISDNEVPRISLEDCDDDMDLNSLRVAFFLHIYHENQAPGGRKSMLYLRQSLTLAQMMRLDRESSYTGLPDAEQQMRRRILWLMFVTERGVALLHKMPAILKPNINLPSPGGDDRAHVLPAFLKLVNLFWVFDQSGIFEVLQNSDSDASNMAAAAAHSSFDILQSKLLDRAAENEPGNDIQRADIFVTRQWMRAVLWRAAVKLGMTTPSNPLTIAKELVSFMAQLPKAAMEAHGPTIEFKTYDVATTVIDAVRINPFSSGAERPEEILRSLEQILLSSRGGNKTLVASLYIKMASIAPGPQKSPTVDVIPARDFLSTAGGPPSSASSSFGSSAIPHASSSAPEQWGAGLGNMLGGGTSIGVSDDKTMDMDFDSLEEFNQQVSWPPLDFSTPLMRSPSPLTSAIFDQLQRKDRRISDTEWNKDTA